MNKWKIAFFTLAGAILFSIVLIVYLATATVDDGDYNTNKSPNSDSSEGNVLVVQTTAKEFESIAKQYLKDAVKDAPFPIEFTIGKDIQLKSELAVFYTEIPITMQFEPIVDEAGNIILKQTTMNVGRLNIPPETAMKIMRDSVTFPSWITVRPSDAEIYVDLSRLNIASGSRVRAKELDLANEKILLEIIVPGE
ncbi:MAG: YpmS family protein [Lysinibacillus sp.]